MKSLYLAGPDVFYQDAVERGEALKDICRSHGFVGLFPLDNNIPENVLKAGKHEIAHWIRLANEDLIRGCDAVMANMSAFRGISMDVGTAYEIGFASALDIPVFSYSPDTRTYVEKMYRAGLLGDYHLSDPEGNLIAPVGNLIAHDGMTVEDFDHHDNLMMVAGHPEISISFEEALLKAELFFNRKPDYSI